MSIRKKLLASAVLAAVTPLAAHASCERDLAGFENTFDSDPSLSAVAPNARTADDFLASAQNFFHLSEGGSDYVENNIDSSSFFGQMAGLFGADFTPQNGIHQIPICSDIGQCAQASIVGHFDTIELPDVGIPIGTRQTGPLGEITIDGGSVDVIAGYTVFIQMADGTDRMESTNVRDLEVMQDLGMDFDLPSQGTEDEAQPSDGCRDNEGNETGEDPSQPSGGGGGGDGGIPPWEPPNTWEDTYWDLPTGQCWSCRATEEGVACRQVARSMCGP